MDAHSAHPVTTTTRPGTSPATVTRRATTRLRRAAGLLAAAIAGLLAFGVTGPSAFAMIIPASPGGPAGPASAPVIRVISTGVGTWQVTLIAIGAALAGAAAAVAASRLRARREIGAPAAA